MGISALFHDSACALLQDGKIVAAVQEERFSRIKNDPSMPIHAFRNCLKLGKINIKDIDKIAYYEDPFLKLERQTKYVNDLENEKYKDKLDPSRVERKIRQQLGYEGVIEFHTHHIEFTFEKDILYILQTRDVPV